MLLLPLNPAGGLGQQQHFEQPGVACCQRDVAQHFCFGAKMTDLEGGRRPVENPLDPGAGWKEPKSLRSPVKRGLTPGQYVLAKLLRHLLAESGNGVRDFAVKRHYDPSNLTRWLQGERIPDKAIVDALLDAVEDAHPGRVSPEVRSRCYEIHLHALESTHPERYRVQILSDRLEGVLYERENAAATVLQASAGVAELQQRTHELEVRILELEEEGRAQQKRSATALVSLREEQRRSEQECDSLRRRIRVQERELEDARRALERATSECADLEDQLDRAEAALLAAEREQESDVRQRDALIRRLRRRLSEAEHDVAVAVTSFAGG
ncbi:hypothetical protein ACIHFC_32285 [Streptomyces sp. NPDC052013]|uniref:hypothetical protein n=1 Tax=Streptomyces sp. NPDC052013 TaxID=3365679 RepID=UPI0037D5EFB5